MTVRELFQALDMLQRNNPGGSILDSQVVLSIGMFKSTLKQRQKEEEDWSEIPSMYIREDALRVTAEEGDNDGHLSVVICAGVEMEAPPIL
jgi:hypothetical protein